MPYCLDETVGRVKVLEYCLVIIEPENNDKSKVFWILIGAVWFKISWISKIL